MARCSRCDARFPLTLPKSRYVLMPAKASVSDPLLAAGLHSSESRVDRPIPPATSGAPADTVGAEHDLPARDADGDEGSGFFNAEIGKDDRPRQAGPDAAKPAPKASRRSTRPLREAIGVFLLAGLGAAVGYHGSLQYGFDPWNAIGVELLQFGFEPLNAIGVELLQFGFEPWHAIGVGLASGLTFGWAWIRWAERKR